MFFKNWIRAFCSSKPPLDGITLHILESRSIRLVPAPGPEVQELEIGATGPSKLQFVLISRRRKATVILSAEQARWLGDALHHWADRSEAIATH